MPHTDSQPKWQLVERLVAQLEHSLVPSASISVNEHLREIATGTSRQCDVVIRTGQPPRQTLTIVEVQHRTDKTEIGAYEGWILKREKLGAQHLLCVSTTGFPESVHKDAASRGGSVRLLTLCVRNEPPPFLPKDFKVRFQVHNENAGSTSTVDLPYEVLEYEQTDIDGALAWIVTVVGAFQGSKIDFQYTFIETHEGIKIVEFHQIMNSPENKLMMLGTYIELEKR